MAPDVPGMPGAGGVLSIFLADRDPAVSQTTIAVGAFAPDSGAGRIVQAPDDELVRRPLPLAGSLVAEECESERGKTARDEPRHKVGGFADWIQVDARMHAYFDSTVPFTEPAALEAARSAEVDPTSIVGARGMLRVVRQLEARGVDAGVLGDASGDFELLAQIDSDRRSGMQWGDAGRLYVFARESDVRARRFDRITVWSDCY